MEGNSTISANWQLEGAILTVRIPIRLKRHAARKRIIVPDDAEGWAPVSNRPNSSLIRALARAHRWRRLLEDGTYTTVAELCQAENITNAYVSRILQLAHLAPDIVEYILDSKAPQELTLGRLNTIPSLWDEQRKALVDGA